LRTVAPPQTLLSDNPRTITRWLPARDSENR
jgi:hypothetical protein